MNLTSRHLLAAAGLGLVALAATSNAHARSDVYFSIGLGTPMPAVVQPAPVYVQPAPVYVQPRPVYVQPPAYYAQPQVVYGPPGHWRHGGRHWQGPWGDRDRDGVPNAYDRHPENHRRR